jgi:hypothetical protein
MSVDLASISTIFQLDFGIVPKVFCFVVLFQNVKSLPAYK